MAYVRKKGQQIAIVQGERDSETGKVNQTVLFTFYSKAEAYRAVGKGKKNESGLFQRLLQEQYPNIKFNWAHINQGIIKHLEILPDLADHRSQRVKSGFESALHDFARHLISNDPAVNQIAYETLAKSRLKLDFLKTIIDARISHSESSHRFWSQDNEFFWHHSLQNKAVDPQIEEIAIQYYEQGKNDRALSAFQLLCDSFPSYAEGHNYAGLIHLRQGRIHEAITSFRQTIEIGRKLFPRKIAKSKYWQDLNTRPYMRGLRNLCLCLNRTGHYDEAIDFCQILHKECGDTEIASYYMTCIHLNRGDWHEAERWAVLIGDHFSKFLAALAQFELGKASEARLNLIYSALNHPIAVRSIVTKISGQPRTFFESQDFELATNACSDLSQYLAKRTRKAKPFIQNILNHPSVKVHVDEVLSCARQHELSRDQEESKQNIQRWRELQSQNFASKITARMN